MKVTLFDNNYQVVRKIPRVRDIMHHSNGTIDVTFEDWTVLSIKRNEYEFFTVEA